MNKKYNRLTVVERVTIHVMRKCGKTVCKISEAVNRPKGTISKELKRHRHSHNGTWNQMNGIERAQYAEDKARLNSKRRGRKKKFTNYQLRIFVIKKLTQEHWSPEAIAAKSEGTVCTKTIYSWIKKERRDLHQYLTERGKPRRQRVANRRGRFRVGAPEKRRIDERPSIVERRKEVGHFEVDCVVSTKSGAGGVLAVRERSLRHRQYAIIPNLKAETVLGVLRAMLLQWDCKHRKTVTFDNGSEFCTTEMSKLEKFFPGLKTYYTDAYSAWQKGSVENSNKQVRWYFGKGTDFSLIDRDKFRQDIDRINRKPMKCLGWRSSQELFDSLKAA